MGKGDFIINMAKKYPNINFIGIEKFDSVLVRALEKVEDDIPNLRFIRMDATEIEDVFYKEIDTIYLNFSDPWPKKRHEKRRLTHKNFTEQYRRILKPEGKLIVKTDNLDFFNFSVESLQESKWILEKINYDYQDDEEFDAITEYTLNWRKKGVSIKRLEAHN